MDINLLIDQLIAFAVNEKLLHPRDRAWAVNQLLAVLQLSDYTPSGFKGKTPPYPCEILKTSATGPPNRASSRPTPLPCETCLTPA